MSTKQQRRAQVAVTRKATARAITKTRREDVASMPSPKPKPQPDDGPIRLISKPELLDRVSLSFPTVWLMMRNGKFPASRVLGGKTVWVESEVNAWLEQLPMRSYKVIKCQSAEDLA